MTQQRVLRQLMPALFPVLDLVDTAPRIFVQRDIEPVDQFRIALLDKPRRILGIVLAGLGNIVAEPAHDLQPHHISVFPGLRIEFILLLHVLKPPFGQFLPLAQPADPLLKGADIQLTGVVQLRPALDLRIQIHPVFGALKQPCLVIDSGDLPLHRIIIFHAQFLEQGRSADLHAVTEAHGFDPCHPQHRAGQHSHGIGIVQHPRIRTDLFHVTGKVQHHRDRAQGAEYAADTKRVGNRLLEAVFLRNLKIGDRTGIISAHLDRIDDIVRAAKRFLPVFNTQILLNPGF